MKRKKTVLGVVVLVGGLAGLWIAGPPAPESGFYVQAVTTDSAIIAKLDRSARRLTVKVWTEEQGAEPSAGKAIEITEDRAVVGHRIRIDGLQAGTRYEFTANAGNGRLHRGSFRTAPGDEQALVRFAAVGDTGAVPWWYNMHRIGWSRLRPVLALTSTPQQWRVAKWIDARDPHFFLHLGDMVYWPELNPAYEEAFFRPFAGLLRDTVLYTMVGNHDIPAGGQTPPFERLFHNPSPDGVGRPARNYTATWGALRLVVLDVLDPTWETGPAREWLEQTLRRATEPWIVVAIHRPCFSVYRQRTEDPALRDRLWKLLTAYAVDLVCSGDDHHFVRYHPTEPGSPIQVTVGAGGKSVYKVEPDERVAASAEAWSFLLVEVQGLRLTARVLGNPGEEFDRLELDRRQGPLPARMQPSRRARVTGLRR